MSVQKTITTKIHEALEPLHLEVVNESYMHNVPPGSESHFRLLIVSDRFEGQTLVQRHQAVYQVLAEEMKDQIHALGLQTLTTSEWDPDATSLAESPECLGGNKSSG